MLAGFLNCIRYTPDSAMLDISICFAFLFDIKCEHARVFVRYWLFTFRSNTSHHSSRPAITLLPDSKCSCSSFVLMLTSITSFLSEPSKNFLIFCLQSRDSRVLLTSPIDALPANFPALPASAMAVTSSAIKFGQLYQIKSRV
jgi:hypothetical protein